MLFGFVLIFFWSSLIRPLTPLLPPPPKRPLRKMSLIPVEPEPTPKATKPTPNTSASRTNIHFVCRRRRAKKSWSSQLCPAFRFCFGCGCCRRFFCACAAPRAIGCLGYLRFGVDRGPVEGVSHGFEAAPRRRVAERSLEPGRVE